MLVRGRVTDLENCRDLAVGRALRDELHDLLLPRRQCDVAVRAVSRRPQARDHLHEAVQDGPRERAFTQRRRGDGALEGSWRHVAGNKTNEAEACGLSPSLGCRRSHKRDEASRSAELVGSRPERRAQQKALGAADEDRVICARHTGGELDQAGQRAHDVDTALVETRVGDADLF